MEGRVRKKRNRSAKIKRSKRYNSSVKDLSKKQDHSEELHPKKKLVFVTVGGIFRLFLTLIGFVIVGLSMWDAVGGIFRGDSSVYYFSLPVILGAGIIVIGVTGYFPSFPEFSPHDRITSDMLVEITKVVLCLVPVLATMFFVESWVESHGYKREPLDYSRSRSERRYSAKVFSKIYELPVKVEAPREIDVSAISVPFPHTGQRQLFITYNTAIGGPLSASRIQTLVKETGAVGFHVEGEVTAEEWATFCADSEKLVPPADFLSCDKEKPGLDR